MQIIRELAALRPALAALRSDGGRLALVPTMGALHSGHMALVEEASRRAPHVVVSIFVNRMQFGRNEDLDAYPRRESADAGLLEEAGVACLWMPSDQEVYPLGFATRVGVEGVSAGLCGASRPGHFDGVATIVAKLLNQVRPDAALFGEKDYQQLAVIRRLVRDLDFEVEIIGVPVVREPDGLACSSRNLHLAPAERAAAATLPATLFDTARALAEGADVAAALASARGRLEGAGLAVEYVELCDDASLAPIAALTAPARLLAAVRSGRTRLIDNVAVDFSEKD